MNRKITYPIPAASDCPVCWRQLVPVFSRTFPRIIEDAIGNDVRARVRYLENYFDIIPEFAPGFPPSFSVWGPAHLNHFPDTL